MEFIINLTNAMTIPMVAFTLVILGSIAIGIGSLFVYKSNKENTKLKHQETMVSIETKHRETIAKIKADDPKMIEARASRSED